jgi:hypothetical protein
MYFYKIQSNIDQNFAEFQTAYGMYVIEKKPCGIPYQRNSVNILMGIPVASMTMACRQSLIIVPQGT